MILRGGILPHELSVVESAAWGAATARKSLNVE